MTRKEHRRKEDMADAAGCCVVSRYNIRHPIIAIGSKATVANG